MDKKTFRKFALEKAKLISNKEVKSQGICETLFSLYSEYEKIAIYMATENEVDLNPFIKNLLTNKNKVFAPKILQNELKFIEIKDLSDCNLERNKFGIMEPINDHYIDVNDIDVIIVPAVAFDRLMNRIGHGKGYYDKSLSNYHGLKVGVCFDELLFNELPIEEHDIKMDAIISDNQKLDFTNHF